MSEAVSTSAASPPERLPDLLAEHRAAGLADHPDQRAGHRAGLLGDGVAHRADDVLGDRLDQHPPHLGGLLDPVRPAPRRRGGDTGGQRRWCRRASGRPAGTRRRPGSGQPVLARVGLLGGGAPGDVGGERASSPARRRAASAPASGPSARRGPARRGRASRRCRAELKICSNGVPLNGFAPLLPEDSSGSSRARLWGRRDRCRRRCSCLQVTGHAHVAPVVSRLLLVTSSRQTSPDVHAAARAAVRLVAVRDLPLDVAEVTAAVSDPAAGGSTCSSAPCATTTAARRYAGWSTPPTRPPRRGSPRWPPRWPRSSTWWRSRRCTAWAARDRRRRGRVRGLGRPPRRGVRGVPGTDRPAQAAGAGLEAPGLRRRHRGVGRQPVAVRREVSGSSPVETPACWRRTRRRTRHHGGVEILLWLVPAALATWSRWRGWAGSAGGVPSGRGPLRGRSASPARSCGRSPTSTGVRGSASAAPASPSGRSDTRRSA